MKKIILFFVSTFFSLSVYSQTSLSGKVISSNKGEILVGAAVALYKGSELKIGTTTDEYGNYRISNIDNGTFTVKVTSLGFQTLQVEKVVLLSGQSNKENFTLNEESSMLTEVNVTVRKVKIIDPDVTTQGTIMTSEQISKTPVRSIVGLVANTAGVSTANGSGLSLRGSRSSGTKMMIDGVVVNGAYLPPSEIEQLQVITGGIEAQYGDVTGGFISSTTKGPSSKLSIYADGETSKFLDPWERSELNAAVSGPILKNKEGSSILGFRLSGRYIGNLDNDPSYSPIRFMTEEGISKISLEPVRTLASGTRYSAGEFDISNLSEFKKVRPNENDRNIDLNGKFDIKVAKGMDVQIGGGITDYSDRFTPNTNEISSVSWKFANYINNPYNNLNRYRGNIRFRHRINSEAGVEKGLLKNVSYTILGAYEKTKTSTEDFRHQDRFFDYGYIGKKSTSFMPAITNELVIDSSGTGTVISVQAPEFVIIDTIRYIPGKQNPVLSNYNNGIFGDNSEINTGLIAENGNRVNNFSELYSIYSNVGQIYNNFQKTEADIYTGRFDINFDLTPNNSDLGTHSITIGLLHEQRIERSYVLAPRALWSVGDRSINEHLFKLDSTSILDTILNPQTGDELVLYNLLPTDIEGNTFYKKFRQRNGIPINQWLDLDNYGPENLSLDMFAPEELTSNGIVNFYGYDYLGNKVKKAGFNEFYTQLTPGENGVRKMLIAPFSPIYQSFYIQDKFQAYDLIIRAGLRIERFDNNTKVLKDPYSLYPMMTANQYYDKVGKPIPDGVDPDAFVYLNSSIDASGVKAFRKGDVWYNPTGLEVQDPNLLFQGGVAIPRYNTIDKEVEPNIIRTNPIYDPNRSFTDYKPQITYSPRLAISLPISEFGNLFGHYDILIQRPNNNYASPLDYYTWTSQTRFDNPDLKPEKNIDYELGYQQLLNASSGIKFSLYYKEVRDLIQRSLINYTNNATQSLLTFRNIDFSTVKGLQIQYDLRRTKNFTLQANYNFQFADGTGSDPETQANIAKRGSIRILSPLDFDERHAFKLNADFRFGEGQQYNGPVWFGADVFSNAGINILASAISGRPYTSNSSPEQFGSGGPTGTYNGARYPWNYNMDLRIDKSFNINSANKEHPLNMIVYVRVSNLLNTRNVFNLYKYSKSADDDGYLVTSRGQSSLLSILNDPIGIAEGRTTDEYLSVYHWRLYNPDFFSQPRRIFIGASINF